jgi:hypothetical protein
MADWVAERGGRVVEEGARASLVCIESTRVMTEPGRSKFRREPHSTKS